MTTVEELPKVESAATTFTTRTVPWMKLGPEITEPVTAAEAARLGGIDFNVATLKSGYANADGAWQEVKSRRAIVRGDNGMFIDYVSQDYVPVQYSEAFGFMDTVNPKFVSAGGLKHGRQGFMVVEMPDLVGLEHLELRGVEDPHQLYVILRTSHDRSKGIEIALMSLRGKCMNQLTLPTLMSDAPQRWSIRHVGDPHAKMQQAQDVLSNATRYARAFQDISTRLADIDVNAGDANIVLKAVLPDRPRRGEQISAIMHAFETSETNGFSGSGWGLVNATSEYFEWLRNSGVRTNESRFTSGLDGDTHKYVGRVSQLLLRSS